MEKVSVVRPLTVSLILAAIAGSAVSDGLVRLSVEVWVANNFGFMVAVFVGLPFLAVFTGYVRHGESEEDLWVDVLWFGTFMVSLIFYAVVFLLNNPVLGLLAMFIVLLLMVIFLWASGL